MRTRDDAIAKARASCRQFELLGFYLFLFLQTNSKYIQDLFTSSCKSLNSVKKCNDLFFLYSYCHAAFSQFFFVISTGHSEQTSAVAMTLQRQITSHHFSSFHFTTHPRSKKQSVKNKLFLSCFILLQHLSPVLWTSLVFFKSIHEKSHPFRKKSRQIPPCAWQETKG